MNTLRKTTDLAAATALVLLSGCELMHPTDPYAGMAKGSSPRISDRARPVKHLQSGGVLSIDQAIRVALANNPELSAMQHDADASEYQRKIAASQRWPSVHVASAYNRYLDRQRLIPPSANFEPGVYNRDIVAGDLVLTMPLFTGGRITSEVKAAEFFREAAGHRLSRTRDELVFNVYSTFYSILAQRRLIESLDFSHKTLQEHLKRVKQFIEAQKAAKVDQLRTKVRLTDLEQRQVQERNILEIQYRVLTNLLGLDQVENPLDPRGELSAPVSEVPKKTKALQEAFADRPDYLAARAGLEAQAQAVDIARAAHWPTMSFEASYGGRWAAGATGLPPGIDRSGDLGQLGVVVDLPIFEGGRIDAQIAKERARLHAAQERLRKLKLQVQLDVETALLNIASARQRVQATESAVAEAKESLRIEREKYETGKGAIVDVLDAQSALLDSQTNFYRAQADYNVALAQLNLATGAEPWRK